LRVYTTVRYLVVQFKAIQKPFMAFGNVPKADNRNLGYRTFIVEAR
jgi:hypothetical protein